MSTDVSELRRSSMTKSRYKGRLRIQSKFGAGQKHCCIGLLHCPAPQGWLGFFRAKRREKNSISYCVFDLVLMYFALFDTIHSPCSIRFGPLRFLIFRLRLKQFSELFYSQNSRVLETLLFQTLFSQRKVSVYTWLILKYRKLLLISPEYLMKILFYIKS